MAFTRNPLPSMLTAVGLAAALSLHAHADIMTDFSSLSAGSVNASTLNGVTTGGTWFISGGGSTEIQVDGAGDRAILSDDTNGGNAGTIGRVAVTATLGNEIDLTETDALFTFRTGTRRTGNNKGLRYQFVSQGGTIIANLDWNHNSQQLILNAGAADQVIVSQAGTGEGFSSSSLGAWDSTSDRVRDVSATFSGSTVTIEFGSETLSASFLNAATDVGRLRLQTIGSENGGAKGGYLDEVTLTSVPEPSSLALLGLGAAMMIRRRRA